MTVKTCIKCGATETYQWYTQNGKPLCKSCYNKSFSGMVSQIYTYMRLRVVDGHCSSPKLYLGLPIMPREEFNQLAAKSSRLKQLHKEWEKSGYQLSLRPVPDRLDSSNPGPGYVASNIIFRTYGENNKRSANKKWSKKK